MKGDPVKAYHVEVIKEKGQKISKGISWLYSSRRKKFPLGEKMRFIPYQKDVQHLSIKVNSMDIVNRHNWFSKLTSYASSFEIASLDSVASGIGKSLRQFIMSMKHPSGQQLFNTVDWNWNNTAVVFVFPTEFEEQARDICHKLGKIALVKYFTPEATERAENAPWDEKLGRAVSIVNQEMDIILEDCEQMNWLRQPTDQQVRSLFKKMHPNLSCFTSLLQKTLLYLPLEMALQAPREVMKRVSMEIQSSSEFPPPKIYKPLMTNR